MIDREVRHLIHLNVGGDLRADEKQVLDGHLERSAECRSYAAEMTKSMSALLTLRTDDSASASGESSAVSVWPAVARTIARRHTSPVATRKFNLQVAMLSVCSLALAVVTIVQSLSTMREFAEPSGFTPARQVGGSPMMNVGRFPMSPTKPVQDATDAASFSATRDSVPGVHQHSSF